MSRIDTLKNHEGHVVEGQYTLCDIADRQTQQGSRYKALHLADCSGDIRVYAWESSGVLDRVPLCTPARVYARLNVRALNGRIIADLQSIHPLDDHEVTNAASLLPLKNCPDAAQPALATLVNFVDALAPPALLGFINCVLLDARIADGLLTCKASIKNHHSQPGGLLIHSIAVMQIAADMAGSRLSPVEKSITQVTALMHDLGKIRAVGSGRIRPVHYQLMSHESQTIRLLEPHLERLRDRAPDLAAAIEYCLEYISQRRSDRKFAKFVGAELVAFADQIDCALVNNRRMSDLLQKTLPASQLRALEQQTSECGPVTPMRLQAER